MIFSANFYIKYTKTNVFYCIYCIKFSFFVLLQNKNRKMIAKRGKTSYQVGKKRERNDKIKKVKKSTFFCLRSLAFFNFFCYNNIVVWGKRWKQIRKSKGRSMRLIKHLRKRKKQGVETLVFARCLSHGLIATLGGGKARFFHAKIQ